MESLDEKLVSENVTGLTLSDIVTKNYKSAAVFEKFGLDFCCHGKKSIPDACEEKGVNAEEVLTQLEKLDENNST